jgi:DNA-binding XRE family transcriptional regulator
MAISSVKVQDVKKAMGSLIKQMRVKRKLTQEALAQSLNLSRITIQNIERGKNFTIDPYLLILQHFDEIASLNDFVKAKLDDYHEIKSIY